jgi:hypothetical protein
MTAPSAKRVVRKRDGTAWIDGQLVGRIERHLERTGRTRTGWRITQTWRVYDAGGAFLTEQYSLAIAKRRIAL